MAALSAVLLSPRLAVTATRSQIHNAAQNPVELDWSAAAAVEARSELDLRIGAAFTRMQTMALQNRFHELSKNIVSYGEHNWKACGAAADRDVPPQALVSSRRSASSLTSTSR